MNAERLSELVSFLLNLEEEWEIQNLLDAGRKALETLQSNPSDPNAQRAAAEAVGRLESGLAWLSSALTPTQAKVLEELGGRSFFSPDLGEPIRRALSDNAATPAVATQVAQRTVGERKRFLDTLRAARSALAALNISEYELTPAEPEIGFTIPRQLFENELRGLTAELSCISRIIDFFSEAATGRKTPVSVRQISTSDPLFSFGVEPSVALAIATSITWLLKTWSDVNEIKKQHHQAKELGAPDSLVAQYETWISEKIESSIEERINQIVGPEHERAKPRDNELANGLRWAHKSLMARIERGMTVETRYLPREVPDEDGAEETIVDENAEKFAALAAKTEFPEPGETPILKLPSLEPPKNSGRSQDS